MQVGRGQIALNNTPSNVITHLGANDVILGRGFPATSGNEGNIRFREVVRLLVPQYVAASRRSEKDALARQVVNAVRGRSGRFVRRVESPQEADTLPVSVNTLSDVWIVVEDDAMILAKIKQTFRDQKPGASESRNRQRRLSSVQKSQRAARAATNIASAMQSSVEVPLLSPYLTIGLRTVQPQQQLWTTLQMQLLSQLSASTRQQVPPAFSLGTAPVPNSTTTSSRAAVSLSKERRIDVKSVPGQLDILADAAVYRKAQEDDSESAQRRSNFSRK